MVTAPGLSSCQVASCLPEANHALELSCSVVNRSPDVFVGCIKCLPKKPESFGSYSVEGGEVIETHPPQVVEVVHARFVEPTGGRGADRGERSSRFHESDITKRVAAPIADPLSGSQKRSFMAGRNSEGPGRFRDMGAALYRAAETVSCFSISCAGMAAPKSAVSGWRAPLRSSPPI